MMKNQRILWILGIVGVALFCLWHAQSSEVLRGVDKDTALVPKLLGNEDSLSKLPELTENTDEAQVREIAATTPLGDEASTSTREHFTSDDYWIEGRVVFPEGMPYALSDVIVIAKGQSSRGKSEFRVSVGHDGKFRVVISKLCKLGTLEASGRFLRKVKKLRLDLRDLPAEIVLEPALAGVLSGVVLAPKGFTWGDGVPEKTRVTLDGRGYSVSMNLDSEGRFEFTGVPKSSDYALDVQSEDWCHFTQDEIKVQDGELTKLVSNMSVGASLSGRVVNVNGAGIAAVDVSIGRMWSRNVKTADDGSFHIKGVSPGVINVRAQLDGKLPMGRDLGILADGSHLRDLTLTMTEGEFIEGLVRWADGSPVRDATVRVTQSGSSLYSGSNIKTAEDGAFRISGLRPTPCVLDVSARAFLKGDFEKAEGGKHPLKARGPDYKAKLTELQPATSGLVVVLDKGGKLSGRVIDDLGQPLTGFTIRALPYQKHAIKQPRDHRLTRKIESEDGSFTIDGLGDGEWIIEAEAQFGRGSKGVRIAMPAARQITLVVPLVSKLRGIVRDPMGEPVEGARVRMSVPASANQTPGVEETGSSWGRGAETDERGRFTFRYVAGGQWTFVARSSGYGHSPEVLVVVPPGEDLNQIEVLLRPEARIAVQLGASIGQVGNRHVLFRPDGQRSGVRMTTDSMGRCERSSLGPGRYQVSLDARGEEKPVATSMEVDVRVGEHVSVVLEARPADPTTELSEEDDPQ